MTDPVTTEGALLEARQAFAEGNYARAREHAQRLAESADGPTREAGLDLLTKMSPAPVGKYLFLLTALLLMAVTYFAYSN